MKKKFLATLLTLGAFGCSAAFFGCNINGGTENGGGNDSGHTSHVFQNYHDNDNGTCTGTCTGCDKTDTIDHVYDDEADTTCNNCGYIRDLGGNGDEEGGGEEGGGEEGGGDEETGMKMKAAAPDAVFLQSGIETDVANITETSLENVEESETKLNPATIEESSTAGTYELKVPVDYSYAPNGAGLNTGIRYKVLGTFNAASTEFTAVDGSTPTDYARMYVMSIARLNNKEDAKLNASVEISFNNTEDNLYKFIRCGFLSGTRWTSIENEAASGSCEYDNGKVTFTYSGDNAVVDDFDGNTAYHLQFVVWFDGPDADCYVNNGLNTDGIEISVTYALQDDVFDTVSVTKVLINKTTLSLTEGESEKLTATVLPSDATNQTVSWSSDDESIAKVDENGKVEAVSAGTAHITVTTADGNKTKTCTVTVTAQQQQPSTVSVTGVSLNKTSLSLKAGENETLTATVAPADATNKEVSWSSDNNSVATVNANGKVEAKAAGTAIITVTTADGNFSKTCTVTVTADQQQPTTVSVTGVSLNKTTLSLKAGENESLIATVAPADATNQSVSWSSDNQSVATVNDNGKVTAKSAGTAIITVTTADGNFSKTCTVTVTADQQQPTTVSVTGVSLNKTTLNLELGDTGTLVATVLPADATNKNVNWSSSNTGVATVNASGDITTKAAGTTTITVTTADGNRTATCTVNVTAPAVKVTGVTLNKSELSLLVNGSEQLTATVQPNNASNKNVTWSSDDETVATVDVSGTVTAHKAGAAVITVSTADGNKTATCSVTVSNRATADIPAAITYSYAGEECAAFEWSDTTTTGTKAEYKLHSAGDGTYKQIDSQLIRLKTDDDTGNTYVRADIVGLKGGEVYDFRLTTSSGNKLIATNMSVYSYDRSGYAHFNASTGVGGYNDDGTLKDNAIVIYVNEANKNNVVVNGSATGKSIVEYLGSMTNNTKPIVVRILGTVGAATWNKLEHNGGVGKAELYKELVGKNGENLATFYGVSKTDGSSTNISQAQLIKDGFNTLNTTEYAELKGLSSKIKFSPKINSKGEDESEFDSAWNDCSLQYLKNVTVEGIGTDARIFQWGFTWKLCDYIEVRNLTFEDYTEDACSFEGSKTSVSSESQFDNRHFWIHHNVFEEGMNYWDVCNEQDKHDGDGSTDFKGLSGITVSYNVYHECHKTGLVGGSDTQTTANVTFHHNYYNKCGSRLPLARQANMHMYNNYYYNSTGTNMSLRAGGYALIENCYFDNANVPIEIKAGADRTGAAKVLDCTFDKKNYSANSRIYDNAKSENINRASEVENDNRFNTKFDTDPTAFYYDSTNLRSNVSQMMVTASVKTVIPKVAGVQKRNDDFTLAITGNNAPCGVKEEGSENPALTKFEELSARADCAYSNNFDSVANGTKFEIFENYSTTGVYSMPNETSAYASNHTAVTNGKAVQVVSNGVNTTTAIAFGNLNGKSTVEGYFEMSTSDIGTKWDLIRFVNSSSSILAAVRIDTDKAAKLTYYTESTESGPAAITPSKSFVWAANTTYKVHFTVNLTSGQISISITGSGVTFEATIAQSATDICGINILSSNKGARLVTIDNLVICAG